MKRKLILTTGLILSIIYSLCLVGSILLVFAGVLYFFLGNSVPIVNDLLLPLINPFLAYGQTTMLALVGALVFLFIFLLICSTRFIRYYNEETEIFNKHRKLLKFNIIIFILVMAGICYLVFRNIQSGNLTSQLAYSIILIAISVLHFVSITTGIIGLSKKIVTKDTSKKSSNSNTAQDEFNETIKPAIYTAGLDGDSKEEQQEEQQQEEETNKVEKVETATTKKLIDAIGKLDKMRQEGQITTQEYTKLRGQMIKKYTK